MCLFLGSRAERAIIGGLLLDGIATHMAQMGRSGRHRECDLVFPRSHNLPRESGPVVVELYIPHWQKAPLFQLGEGIRLSQLKSLNPESRTLDLSSSALSLSLYRITAACVFRCI